MYRQTNKPKKKKKSCLQSKRYDEAFDRSIGTGVDEQTKCKTRTHRRDFAHDRSGTRQPTEFDEEME